MIIASASRRTERAMFQIRNRRQAEAAEAAPSIRTINQPKPIEVQPDGNDLPRVVTIRQQRRKVLAIQDVWRVDDEWWRDGVSRRYFRVTLEGDLIRTIYHDLLRGGWYEQSY
jgi:hypothetical protein